MSESRVDVNEYIFQFAGTVYLTAIQLFQGIALALLLTRFIDFLFPSPTDKISSGLYQGLYIYRCYIFSVMAIFTIWHHYIYRILYLKWFPNIWDSIIPFSLGTSEISMILILGKMKNIEDMKYWYFSASILCFCGFFAYWHGRRKTDPELYPSELLENVSKFFELLKRAYASGGKLCATMGLVFLLIGLKVISEFWFYIIIVLFIIHIVWYEYYHCQKIKPAFLSIAKDSKLFLKDYELPLNGESKSQPS